MKFCHTLDAQRKLSPVEWGPFFLNYELLKKKIKAMTAQQLEQADDNHPSSDSGASDTSSHQGTHRTTTPEALSSSQSEVEFFRLMDYEISRGAQFLALSEGEYVLKTRAVLNGFRSTERLLQSPLLGLDKMIPEETAMEMWMRPMQACISVYRELLLLNHWVIVSYCGFSKILKKHDRWTGFITKEKYLRLVVAKQHFTSYPKLHAMLRDMDTLYLSILKRLPQCPQKAAAEATMGEIKRVVAAAGLAFAQDSQELTSFIQDQHRQQKLAAPTPPIGPPKGHWNYSSSGSDSGSNSAGGDGDGSGSGRGSENSDASQEERVSRKAAAAGAAPVRAAAFLPRITGIRVRGGAKGAPHPTSKRLRMMIEQNRAEICRHQSGTFLPSSVVEDGCRDGAAATEPPVPSVTPPHHAGGASVVIGGDKGGAGVVIGEDGGGDANRLPMGDAAGPGAEAAGTRRAGAKRFAVARGGGLFKVGVTVRMRASPPAEAVAPPPRPPRPPLAARSLGHLAAAAAAAAAADGDVDC